MPRSKVSLAVGLLAILASLFLFVGPAAQAQNGRSILITQSLDESKLITLAGNTRPEANKENDRGLVADSLSMEHMLLQLKRSPEQERALLQYIEELQVPSSPNFHRWLTAKQFGQRFGLATQDLNVIIHWLESHGLKVNVVYTNGLLIDFSGTAGQVRSAFHTEIHELDVKGIKHFANMSDPRIPAALAPAIVGVVSLHDFKPHTNYKPRPDYTFVGCGDICYSVVPGDLATIYNLNPLFNASISGQGQTIVVIEDTDVYTTTDWTTFRSTFGLSSYTEGTFTQVHPAPPTGTNNCTDPGVNGDDGEAILDAEYASAAAPSAAIQLASCSNTSTFGGLIAIQNLLNESATPPAIMSMSYGDCEAFNGATSNAAYNTAFQQAVTEGVSFFVSAGDEAAASCDVQPSNAPFSATHGIGVSGFASTPYNVAVGGTDFGDSFAGTNGTYWNDTNSSTYESAVSYVPEIPWNDSCASLLFAEFFDYPQTYGSTGSCNSTFGEEVALTTVGGSGGPSGCATGSPSTAGVVGGTCKGWPKPSYQSVFGNPSDGVRDLPDVSLFAGNGVWSHYYVYCWSDPTQSGNGSAPCTAGQPEDWAGGGGTSFASPIMAGIQALVNQKTGARQGNPNTLYYSLAAAEYGASGDSACNSTLGNTVGSSCIFYDVTLGDMDVNCTGTVNCYLPSGTYGVLSTSSSSYLPAYGTTTGWDFATGIGTVNAANLANNWPSSLSTTTTTVSSSQNPAKEGVAVTFTATVTTKGANPPTGTVTFNDGTTSIGSGTLATVSGSQVATLTISTLTAGSHSITAVYGGDANNASSTSAVLTQTITGDTTATNLGTSNLNPAYGASVTLTATVSTSGTHTPTGTVTFYNVSTSKSIGSGTLSGSGATATATYATKSTDLAVGGNQLTAAFGGDANNSGSTSQPLTVTAASPTYSLTNTGATSATVLAGIPGSGYAFTIAPVAPAPNFGANVTLSCAIAPADPTLTPSACVFSGTGIQNNIIPATSGSTAVTLNVTTAGPNTAGGIKNLRRRADNRSPWLPLALPLAGIVMVGLAGRKMSRYSVIAALCASLVLLGLLIACGSSNSTPPPVGINVTPAGSTLWASGPTGGNWPAQTASFTATVTNSSSNAGVNWALSSSVSCTGNPNPCGSFTSTATSTGSTLAYTAPTVAGGLPGSVTVTATSAADSTKTAKGTVTITPTTVPGTYTVTLQITDPAAQTQPTNLQFTLVVQ